MRPELEQKVDSSPHKDRLRELRKITNARDAHAHTHASQLSKNLIERRSISRWILHREGAMEQGVDAGARSRI
jgi:hypothetical protein